MNEKVRGRSRRRKRKRESEKERERKEEREEGTRRNLPQFIFAEIYLITKDKQVTFPCTMRINSSLLKC